MGKSLGDKLPYALVDFIQFSARRYVAHGAVCALTPMAASYTICSMGVETIGEAFSAGWRIVARCVRGREDGPSSKSSRECAYRRELDLETLVCTRGRAFPPSRLESRLRCPRCGNRRMVAMFEPPPSRAASA
jgi:DNA-directed RNA polymerase subunit RPC12/RpoP